MDNEYRIRYMSLSMSICDSAVRCYIFSILAASMVKRIYVFYSHTQWRSRCNHPSLYLQPPPLPPPPTGREPVGLRGVVYQRNEVSHSLGISQTPGLSRGVPPSYRVSTLLPGFPRFPLFQDFHVPTLPAKASAFPTLLFSFPRLSRFPAF
jgi:hypothetical protein